MILSRRRALQAAALMAAPARAAGRVSFSYQKSSAVLIAARAQGRLEQALRERGYDASWNLFTRITDAMTGNAVDFHGDVADAVPVFVQASGAPLTYYAREAPSPRAEAILVRADSALTEVAALKGRRIGVSKGSGCHYLVLSALRRAGLSASDVQLVFLEAQDGSAAFQGGSLDAWAIWDPFLAIAEAEGAVRRLADGEGHTDYNRFYMVASAFLAARPELVRLVFDELVRVGAWLRANPAEAAALLAPVWGGVPEPVIRVVNSRRSYDVGPVTPQALEGQQRIADAFFQASMLDRPVRAADAPVWRP